MITESGNLYVHVIILSMVRCPRTGRREIGPTRPRTVRSRLRGDRGRRTTGPGVTLLYTTRPRPVVPLVSSNLQERWRASRFPIADTR